MTDTARWQYSVADLRARYSITLQEHTRVADSDWRDLSSGDELAQSRRFQALIRANEQLRKVCAGERVTPRMKNGRDDSLNNQRAIFVCQLIHAHYPHDEIRALAHHFTDVLARKPERLESDIDNLLQRYTPADYRPKVMCGSASMSPLARPCDGRPMTLTHGELIDIDHQYAKCGPRGIVLEWTSGEVAQHLGVSYDTVQRREAALIAIGTIRRQVSDDRQHSFAILSPSTWEVYAKPMPMPNRSAVEHAGGVATPGASVHPDPEASRGRGDGALSQRCLVIEMLFSDPTIEATVLLARGDLALIQFNDPPLLAAEIDSKAYGAYLSSWFFADQNIRDAFNEARSVAQKSSMPPTGATVRSWICYVLSTLLSLEEALPPEQRTPPSELTSRTLDDYLDRRARPADAPASEVLIFDQFEEILAIEQIDRAAKTAFFAQLGDALRNPRR